MITNVFVPSLGESIKQATLLRWIKPDGAMVAADEPLCELETDKANVDVPSPVSGTLKHAKQAGDAVNVGEAIAQIREVQGSGARGQESARNPEPESRTPISQSSALSPQHLSPATPVAKRLADELHVDLNAIPGSGPAGRKTKEDVMNYLLEKSGSGEQIPKSETRIPKQIQNPKSEIQNDFDASGLRRQPMSKMRKRIAERLVSAQHTAAILTTFNEIDLAAVIDLRARYKERFSEVYGVNLGFMSFFARAAVLALREFPAINAFIEEDTIVYHRYVHLGVAVSTERGLLVPVLRNVQDMSFAKIESEIKRLATSAKDGKLALEELTGATFTITNGGVFGSLLSTPILTPPQSGILGMHAIQKRPVAINDKVEIRPMMYVALSYDHRLVDGRESVSFLVRLKQLLEDPARLMLEV